MDKPINLEGHHIPSLNEYILWREISAKWDPFDDLQRQGYGSQYISNKKKVFNKIYSNPSLEILIVEGFGVLCLGGCLKKNNCQPNKGYDRHVATIYGYEVGKVYLSKDFINYVQRTQNVGELIQ